MISGRVFVLLGLLLVLVTSSCADSDDDEQPLPAGLSAPSSVALTGALPDLMTPVPPGQGELGRVTLSWTDNSADESGFRVYQECDFVVSPLLEVGADEAWYGPLQACRPGRIGVAAFNSEEESAIAWAE